jgi:hypothetical protein
MSLNGSYLRAAYPIWEGGNLRLQTFPTQGVSPTTPRSLQQNRQPTGSNAWEWESTSGSSLSQLQFIGLQLSTVDTGGTQHDVFRGFLAGLVLGIAGGALIALFQEFVQPLSNRRDNRRPRWSDVSSGEAS